MDELVSTLGCHRKHAIRLLKKKEVHQTEGLRPGRRVYDQAVVEALVVLWEAADRICGKRLVRILGQLVTSMERHGHINLEPGVRARVLSASAATIDRVLRSVRESARGERKRRRLAKKSSQQIPTRTFADWKQPRPGHLRDRLRGTQRRFYGRIVFTQPGSDRRALGMDRSGAALSS